MTAMDQKAGFTEYAVTAAPVWDSFGIEVIGVFVLLVRLSYDKSSLGLYTYTSHVIAIYIYIYIYAMASERSFDVCSTRVDETYIAWTCPKYRFLRGR